MAIRSKSHSSGSLMLIFVSHGELEERILPVLISRVRAAYKKEMLT